MSIGDHAISDRAISAPEDTVVVVDFAAGRVVVRDRLATSVGVSSARAGGVFVADELAGSVGIGDAGAGRVVGSDAAVGNAA